MLPHRSDGAAEACRASSSPPIEILVVPRAAYERRRSLFDALSTLFRVRFGVDVAVPDAVVRFDGDDRPLDDVPQLSYLADERSAGPPAAVELAGSADVHAALRSRRIDDEWVGDASLPASAHRPMATTVHGAVWTRHGLLDRACLGPDELSSDERLRARLTRGRFLALLPLLDLIRRVAPGSIPDTPPMATFVFDDPNLRLPTYGWLRYDELAKHARAHGYHVNLAVIPLDCWSVSSRAADLVRSSPHLSLVGHGNDHLRHELAARTGDLTGRAAQAAARLRVAERRWDLRVDPIMVPPHGKCSPQMMDALLRTGWEATAYWGPTRPASRPSLEGWLPADRHVGSSLPGLLRTVFATPAEELSFRRYLGHGLILYGHHDDVSEGLDVLADAAARVGSVGPVEWGSLAEVARSRVTVHRSGTRLTVTPYTRSVVVPTDGSANEIVVVPSPTADPDATFVLRHESGHDVIVHANEVVELAGPGRLTVTEPTPVVAPSTGPGRRRARPLTRRIMTESRDRLRPSAARLRSRLTSNRT